MGAHSHNRLTAKSYWFFCLVVRLKNNNKKITFYMEIKTRIHTRTHRAR